MGKIKRIITNGLESGKGRDILVVLIVILVGFGSFELGRLSKESEGAGIKIDYSNLSANEPASAISAAVEANSIQANLAPSKSSASTKKTSPTGFFASSRGHKYYPLGCSAGKTIKTENRIYFATSTEAEAAGYTLSSSC